MLIDVEGSVGEGKLIQGKGEKELQRKVTSRGSEGGAAFEVKHKG